MFDPAVDVRALDSRPVRDAEGLQVTNDRGRHSQVSFHEDHRRGAATQGFHPDRAGPGKEIEKRPPGNGVAQNAEQGPANQVGGRAQLGIDRAREPAPFQRARHNSKLRLHRIFAQLVNRIGFFFSEKKQ